MNSLCQPASLEASLQNPVSVFALLEISPWYSSELIEKCAIVRWFDEETMMNFMHIAKPDNVISKISHLAIFEVRNSGFALHDLIRDKICDNIYFKSPERFSLLHLSAANYYRNRINRYSRLFSQMLFVELLYHTLRANEDEGIAFLDKIFSGNQSMLQSELIFALLETTHGLKLNNNSELKINKWQKIFNNHN